MSFTKIIASPLTQSRQGLALHYSALPPTKTLIFRSKFLLIIFFKEHKMVQKTQNGLSKKSKRYE